MAGSPSADQARRFGVLSWLSALGGALIVAWLVYRHVHHAASGAGHVAPHETPPLWAALPFAGLLLSIAIIPLLHRTRHWWESNQNRLAVSLGFGALAVGYLFWARGAGGAVAALEHIVASEYIPFMALLFSLYVISGGIVLRGDLPAHPATNTAFLAFGALIASFIGTTGASMLLIRPVLQTNAERKHVAHTVVFFIFLVSNIGGCLLPLGDPPLYLGYLRGVPFTWTLHLWREWAFCSVVLLIVYYVWDSWAYRKETTRDLVRDETQRVPLSLRGGINVVWLMGVVACLALIDSSKALPFGLGKPFPFLRELLMLALVVVSLVTTPRGLRAQNQFNYAAILEVAALFIGIFITMQVPIEILSAKGDELGLSKPWQFFWATGGLSSFLDNAPTYVVFFETANALTHASGPGITTLLSGHFIRQDLLEAISLGAVFMGANTYIGNGPNFMVKSIAEQSGVKMPSFFGYMLYSLLILVPIFVLITYVFLL